MRNDDFNLKFPHRGTGLDQDEEFCTMEDGECTRRIRFHDYHEIYQVEGLYEHIFYDVLKCDSPRTVCRKITEVAEASEIEPRSLRVLDIGAGNGMVGQELREMGAQTVIGVDIIPEARDAQLRDRPGVYDRYFVEDLTALPHDASHALEAAGLNCMTTVAALGFGDIPPRAFSEGFNLIEDGGIIAFNIRDKFVEHESASAFSSLIEAIEREGILDVRVREKYRHRLDIDHNPLYYYVIAGIKASPIPGDLVGAFE